MSSEVVLHVPPTAQALKLLIGIFKTPAIKIQESSEPTPKLVLENGQEITGENTVSEFLGESFDKINWTPELRAETHEWLSRSSKFNTDPEEAFDCWMATRCLALRTPKPTWVDYFLYARLHPLVKSWSKEETWQHPAIFRFFDYIQNRPEIARGSIHGRGQFEPISLSNVNAIPDEYKVPRNERPTNCLPVVARSSITVAAVTKSLAATSLDNKPAASPAEPVTVKKDKKAEKQAKKADKKVEKKSTGGSGQKQDNKPEDGPNPGMVDLRVGLIRKAEKHPDADSLYVSHIDVGEEKERIVCSGLVKYIPLDEMQNRVVVCVCNLKEVKMRGIMSQAMVLAASERTEGDAEKEKVELVIPPPGAKPGTKVYVSSFENVKPESILPPKKKIFEIIQPGFTTLSDLTVAWAKPETEGAPYLGLFARVDGVEIPCKVPSLVGATVR